MESFGEISWDFLVYVIVPAVCVHVVCIPITLAGKDGWMGSLLSPDPVVLMGVVLAGSVRIPGGW